MSLVVTLLFALGTLAFESTIDRAFSSYQNNEWVSAASALDEAYGADPATFEANNFHYLRGRIAEHLSDWNRARDEYRRIAPDNPLHFAAVWRTARASIKLHDDAAARELVALLPADFPADLKIQLAREAEIAVAASIYEQLSTREARLERAKASGDQETLWTLIRENKDDDVALGAAQLVSGFADSPTQRIAAGEVFLNHRQFQEALPLYEQAATDPANAAEARYQIARVYYQQQKYELAIDSYRSIAKDFEGTDWEKESEYQMAASYWRLGDYRNAEQAYLDYIRKYGKESTEEAATRNLVDVYRVLGEYQKAIATVDRALASRLSVPMRQVLIFTKAKILYTQKRYSAALALFQQLGRLKLRTAPGSTTADEVQYFQALCLFHLGNKTAANLIWRKLADDKLSYYGQRSAQKLGKEPAKNTGIVCSAEHSPAVNRMELDVARLRHELRTEMDSTADALSELIFLRLWDEAAYWMRSSGTRMPAQSAAQIAYLGEYYDRSISLASRLPRTGLTLPLIYPAGYHRAICEAATASNVDPLWLQAIIWQESKYNPKARSGAAARGLMQFIPETAQAVGSSIGMPNVTVANLYEPAVSIQLGAAYWSTLMQKLKSPEMALAAYNGGPENVERWLSKSSDPELFVSDIGFVETKKYVMSVFAAHAAYSILAE